MVSFLDNYFHAIKQLIPSKSEETSMGVDIGMGECKLVELKKVGDSFELLNCAVEPVVNNDMRATLKKILETQSPSCKSMCTAIFGKGTLIRYINMPRMSLEELKCAFSIEADKYFPFAQDEIYTDCYILDDEGKDKQMAVMAAAAKKELIDQRIQLLTDLGLQVNFVGINPIALANVINVLGFKEEEENVAVAILDMGESVSNLTMMVNRLPRFTRDIFVGGHDFTKSISNALGVSVTEAEKLKRNPKDKSEQIVSACESTIMNMVQELRLSFDYFSTEKNYEIKKLFLTGGASMLNGVASVFKNNLEVSVENWNPMSTLKMSENINEEEVSGKALKCGVALGLALYGY